MVIAVPIALWGYILFISNRGRSGWVRYGILLAVAFLNTFLHRIGVGANHQTWLFLKRRAADAHGVAGNLHRAFRAGKDQTLALLSSINEVHAEGEVEPFSIVEQAKHDVESVAPVFPEAQSSGRHSAGRTICAGNEVGSAEQVNEEIARHSAAVGLPLPPLKEVLGIEWNRGGGPEETRPIAGFGRCIQGNCVVPRSHRRIAVPTRIHHVELPDRA